ncbi:MAG: PAS domain S-box protein, partial [Bacillota bacterium]
MKKLEHYTDLVENASDLIQCVTPLGEFQYVNNAWKSKLGYSDKEIEKIKLWDVIHPDSMQHCIDT